MHAPSTVSFYNLAVIFNLLIMWFLLERALKRKAKGDKDEARKSRKLSDKVTVVVPCPLCTKAGIYDPLNPHSRSSARNCPLRSPNIDDYLKAVLHGNFSRSVVKIGFGNLLRLEGNDAIRFSKEVELAVDLVRYVAITSMLLASFFITRWFSDHDAATPTIIHIRILQRVPAACSRKKPNREGLTIARDETSFQCTRHIITKHKGAYALNGTWTLFSDVGVLIPTIISHFHQPYSRSIRKQRDQFLQSILDGTCTGNLFLSDHVIKLSNRFSLGYNPYRRHKSTCQIHVQHHNRRAEQLAIQS